MTRITVPKGGKGILGRALKDRYLKVAGFGEIRNEYSHMVKLAHAGQTPGVLGSNRRAHIVANGCQVDTVWFVNSEGIQQGLESFDAVAGIG